MSCDACALLRRVIHGHIGRQGDGIEGLERQLAPLPLIILFLSSVASTTSFHLTPRLAASSHKALGILRWQQALGRRQPDAAKLSQSRHVRP